MNDAQRKAMEQAADVLAELQWAGRNEITLKSFCLSCGQDRESGQHGDRCELKAAIAALRAQLDAPAEKVEPFAWAYKRIIEGRGIRFIEKRAEMPPNGWVEYEEIPLYLAPPTAAQIAAAARAEAIEECVKLCEYVDAKNHHMACKALVCAKAIRALSATNLFEGREGI